MPLPERPVVRPEHLMLNSDPGGRAELPVVDKLAGMS